MNDSYILYSQSLFELLTLTYSVIDLIVFLYITRMECLIDISVYAYYWLISCNVFNNNIECRPDKVVSWLRLD